jgi:hypothetical protein
VALHVSTPLLEHRVDPGSHVPLQTPLTQAWLVHSTGTPQVPPEPHAWAALPEHCFCPAVQEPEQAPLVH